MSTGRTMDHLWLWSCGFDMFGKWNLVIMTHWIISCLLLGKNSLFYDNMNCFLFGTKCLFNWMVPDSVKWHCLFWWVSYMWKGRLRSSSSSLQWLNETQSGNHRYWWAQGTSSNYQAFSEYVTMEKLRSCMASLLEPYKDALHKANSDIDSLKSQVVARE